MLKSLSKIIYSSSFKEESRKQKQDFVRNRKLCFSTTIIFMLNLVKKSLAIEISNFVEFASNMELTVDEFTTSAYVQARMKIKPLAFQALLKHFVDDYYTDNDLGIKLWRGFRLLAVDGSLLNLPYSIKVAKKYGYARNQNGDTNVQCRISVLYDVLNNIIVDANINPRKIMERELAIKHLKQCKNNDLIIFDRGYYSYSFVETLDEINFIVRLKNDLNVVKAFLNTNKMTQITAFYSNEYVYKKKQQKVTKPPIKIRLIKVILPSGQIEVLATSLLNSKKYLTRDFKEMYFKRWKIETLYDELKNKLKIEHFTGYSETAIIQDFYSTLLISNIQSIIVKDIEEEILTSTQGRKYRYKVNANQSYGHLKNKILKLLFNGQNYDTEIDRLKLLFRKNLIPIRPNRSFKRNKIKRKTSKHKVTKNQRDAI